MAATLLIISAASFAQNMGSRSSVSGAALEKTPDILLSNTLQGRINGLVTVGTSNGLGNNTSTLYVRGLHGSSDNAALVIVDGMERNLDDISAEEIESITVLKDATAQILYGSRAANGVILVSTKRGFVGKQEVRVSVESGAKITERTPSYLNSFDYATLYNEALSNDGLPARYNNTQLEGYRNSNGANDLLYPDVDHYSYMMRKAANYRKATIGLAGGTEKIRYSASLIYTGGNGFERYNAAPDYNRINLNGNVDAQITDFLSISASIAARMKLKTWSGMLQSDLFSAISTTRPNDYPMMIAADLVGKNMEDGIPAFGASTKSASNMLADLVYGGNASERYITAISDIGLHLNLEKYVHGLKGRVRLMMDNYSYIAQKQASVYPTYALTGTNPDHPEFTQMRNLSLETSQSVTSDAKRMTLGTDAETSYSRGFGRNEVSVSLSNRMYRYQNSGDAQNIMNVNTALALGWNYDQKVTAGAIVSLMNSNKFAGKNRNFVSFAAEASWSICDEARIKASCGLLGYDRGIDYLLYNTAWQNGASVLFGEQNKGTIGRSTVYVRTGASLKWEKALQANIGFDGKALDGRLGYELDFFIENRSNIICASTSTMTNVVGTFITPRNAGSVRNLGTDMAVTWQDKVGDFSYKVGLNAIWSRNTLTSWNEPNYSDGGIAMVGKPTDAIRGYEAVGLFGKDVKIEESATQQLGTYGNGSIAYKDLNGDGKVDTRDRKLIGNTFPRLSAGLSFEMGWKGLEFSALGTLQGGMDNILNSTYYWMSGDSKYSSLALNRYHPVNNPEGTMPSLTTLSGANNFQNSTFWIQNATFFRLKNVELSYRLGIEKKGVDAVSFFVRGANLLVLTGQKELDPEVVNAGITNYPYYRTVTCGISLTLK